jgi:hypothetical protein
MSRNKLNNRTNLYDYAAKVQNAKLDCAAKALLWFYAYTFNWTENRYSFYPQRKICALVGMSTSTYHEKRKYLEDLRWIVVKRRGFKETCLVRVTEGIDDPDYERRSWAKWHPSKEMERPRYPEVSHYEPELSETPSASRHEHLSVFPEDVAEANNYIPGSEWDDSAGE